MFVGFFNGFLMQFFRSLIIAIIPIINFFAPVFAQADQRDAKFLETLVKFNYTGKAVPGELVVKFKAAGVSRLSSGAFSSALTHDAELQAALRLGGEVRALTPLFATETMARPAAFGFPSLEATPEHRGELSDIYMLKLNGEVDPAEVLTMLKRNAKVAWVEPNFIHEAQLVPNDYYYSRSNSWNQGHDDLWGLKKIEASQAWDIAQGAGTTVAVIDTGVDYNHPDMASNIWINTAETLNNVDDDNNGFIDDIRGWDFTTCARSREGICIQQKNRDNNPFDDNGHGTHVAGTIAAVGNNSIGIIGVAPQAKVMPIKVLSPEGSGSEVDIAAGVVYAANNGADVINVSLGGEGYSNLYEAVFDYAKLKGVISVAAAGNSNADVENFAPANLPSVITVGSSDQNDIKSEFSNFTRSNGFGPLTPVNLIIAAPGGGSVAMTDDLTGVHRTINILSLRAQGTDMYAGAPNYADGAFVMRDGITPQNGAYYRARGTSMACPHVAGAAALILSDVYKRTPRQKDNPQQAAKIWDEVNSRLILGADRLAANPTDFFGSPISIGAGRLNVFKSLALTPRPFLKVLSDDVAESAGNGNLVVNNNEEGTLTLELANVWEAAENVELSIASLDTATLEFTASTVSLGALGAGQALKTAQGAFKFKVKTFSRTAPVPLELTARVTAGGATFDQIIPVKIILGAKKLTSYSLSARTSGPSAYSPPLAPQPYSFVPDVSAAIEGQRIVWSEQRNGKFGIYLYDLASNQLSMLSDPAYDAINPAISGDVVAWQEDRSGDWDIFFRPLSSGGVRLVPVPAGRERHDQVQPKVSARGIVWTDAGVFTQSSNTPPNSDVYFYNFASGQTQALTNNLTQQQNIVIAGDSVAWEDRENAGVTIIPNLANTSRRLDIFPLTSYAFNPSIHKSKMVVSALNLALEVDIFQSSLDAGKGTASSPIALTSDGGLKINPQLSDDYLIWQDGRTAQWEIGVKNLQTGQSELITRGIPQINMPALSGRNVIWLSGPVVWLSDLAGGAPVPGKPPPNNGETLLYGVSLKAKYVAKKKTMNITVSALDTRDGLAAAAIAPGCLYSIYSNVVPATGKRKTVPVKILQQNALSAQMSLQLSKLPGFAPDKSIKRVELKAGIICPNTKENFSNSVKLKPDSKSGIPLKKWLKQLKKAVKKAIVTY